MGWIFTTASIVLVWLGEDDTGDTEQAIDFLYMLFDTVRDDPQAWQQRVEERPEYESGRHAVTNLLAVKWFERMWVFQEALCAKDLVFRRGEWLVPHTLLVLALRYYFKHENLSSTHEPPFENVDRIYDILQARIRYIQYLNGETYTAYALSMLGLVERTHGMGATDPRDKIYALLHLARDEDSLKIQPRYDRTFEECYMDATRRILKTDGKLLCLSLVLLTEAHQNDLPTWTPDFRSISLRWYKHFRMDPEYRLYTATGESRVCMNDTADQTHLALRGLCVGTITAVSTPSGSNDNIPGTIGRDVLDKEKWFRFAQEQVKQSIYPSTGETIETVFADIICGDVSLTVPDGEPQRLHSSARALQQRIAFFEGELLEEQEYPVTSDNFHYANPVCHATHYQRMIYLDTGYLGLATRWSMIGDKVFLLMGADMPCLLRPVGDNYYAYLSEAYIHGIMDGEGLVNAKCRADPTSSAEDSSWLRDLGDPPYPFETEEVILV
jgi:hypothetical protein